MKQFNNQFATQKLRETSATAAGQGASTVTPSTVNKPAVQDWTTGKNKKVVRKKIKEEDTDVETKLAAGPAKIYPKEKWGWKEAPSIPNRPSKMFDYEKIFESPQELTTVEKIILQAEKEGYIGKGGANQATMDVAKEIAKEFDALPTDDEKKARRDQYFKRFLKLSNLLGGKEYVKMNENYSKFRKETRTKTNEQQFHAAVRLAEKKIREANRILEYTAQLKSELSVIKENKNTQKLMERITKGIAEAYRKMKNLK